jgi:outer membrane receptor protein involved in Fe transport
VFFNIPSGLANQTLPKYIEQTGLQVLFPTEDVRGIVTNEIHGELEVTDALARMTQGTRLRYEFIDSDAVTVTVVPPPAVDRYPPPHESPLVVDRRSLAIETVTVSTKLERPTADQLAAELRVMKSDELQASGFSTVQEALRTLPQIFGGGPTEDTHQIGFEAQKNAASGSGVNLRGLGAGSTLVLINGRRLPGGGSEGIFTDISNLPLAAVERIEILPDSSSTVFGADAVGGVVNLVLLNSLDGKRTEASMGTASRGTLKRERVAQLFGLNTRWFDGVIGADFYAHDNLAAADRRQARSDLTIFKGGTNFDTQLSNPGTIIAGGQTYAVPAGQDGKNLTVSDLVPGGRNLTNRYEGVDLLPEQQRISAFATGKKVLPNGFEVFLDALVSQRDVRTSNGGIRTPILVPASNAFNPFTRSGDPKPVQVGYDFSNDLGAAITNASVNTVDVVAGTERNFGDAWHVTATADYGRERLRSGIRNSLNYTNLTAALADDQPETAFNPFGDGSHTNRTTLEGLRAHSRLETHSRLWTGNITATRLFKGPNGGKGRIVGGVDHRKQLFDSRLGVDGLLTANHALDRTMNAGFAEIMMPVLTRQIDEQPSNELEFSLAGRYEHYSDFGHIVTPRFGVTFSPARSFSLRGTWSRSFRPPNLLDLDESANFNAFFGVLDPAAPGGQSVVLVQTGKNANLREERARSWTLGLDWEVLPDLTTALTLFDTRFTDRMNIPTASASLLVDPTLADLVTLNPSAEERAAVCARAPLFNGPAAACLTQPIAALVDLRVRNSTLMRTRGLDLLGEYRGYIGTSSVTFRLDGTYLFSFSESTSRTLPLTEKVSTQNNPIDFRLRSALTWQRGPLRTTALVEYFDDYRDVASIPQRRVDSWTQLTLNLAYITDSKRSSLLSAMTVSLDAENVFNTRPPFLNNAVGIGYDQENGELTGRILSLRVSKDW